MGYKTTTTPIDNTTTGYHVWTGKIIEVFEPLSEEACLSIGGHCYKRGKCKHCGHKQEETEQSLRQMYMAGVPISIDEDE